MGPYVPRDALYLSETFGSLLEQKRRSYSNLFMFFGSPKLTPLRWRTYAFSVFIAIGNIQERENTLSYNVGEEV